MPVPPDLSAEVQFLLIVDEEFQLWFLVGVFVGEHDTGLETPDHGTGGIFDLEVVVAWDPVPSLLLRLLPFARAPLQVQVQKLFHSD